jgi:hypothetical protein
VTVVCAAAVSLLLKQVEQPTSLLMETRVRQPSFAFNHMNVDILLALQRVWCRALVMYNSLAIKSNVILLHYGCYAHACMHVCF